MKRFLILVSAVALSIAATSCVKASYSTRSYSSTADSLAVYKTDSTWLVDLITAAGTGIVDRVLEIELVVAKGSTKLPSGTFECRDFNLPHEVGTFLSGYLVEVKDENSEYELRGSHYSMVSGYTSNSVLFGSGSLKIEEKDGKYNFNFSGRDGSETISVAVAGNSLVPKYIEHNDE